MLTVKFFFQIDTGAKQSILPYSVYQKYFSTFRLSEAEKRLSNYSGGEIPVRGCIRGRLAVGSKSGSIALYIVERGTPILGMDAIQELSLLAMVNNAKGRVTK